VTSNVVCDPKSQLMYLFFCNMWPFLATWILNLLMLDFVLVFNNSLIEHDMGFDRTILLVPMI